MAIVDIDRKQFIETIVDKALDGRGVETNQGLLAAMVYFDPREPDRPVCQAVYRQGASTIYQLINPAEAE